jgi:hypothetical protein
MKRWPAFILLCSQLICGTSAWGNSQSALGWQRTGCEETKFRFPELSENVPIDNATVHTENAVAADGGSGDVRLAIGEKAGACVSVCPDGRPSPEHKPARNGLSGKIVRAAEVRLGANDDGWRRCLPAVGDDGIEQRVSVWSPDKGQLIDVEVRPQLLLSGFLRVRQLPLCDGELLTKPLGLFSGVRPGMFQGIVGGVGARLSGTPRIVRVEDRNPDAADTNRTQNQLPDRHVNRVFVGVRRPDIGVQALLAALVGFGALVGGVLLGALSSNPDPVNRLPRRKPYPQKAAKVGASTKPVEVTGALENTQVTAKRLFTNSPVAPVVTEHEGCEAAQREADFFPPNAGLRCPLVVYTPSLIRDSRAVF